MNRVNAIHLATVHSLGVVHAHAMRLGSGIYLAAAATPATVAPATAGVTPSAPAVSTCTGAACTLPGTDILNSFASALENWGIIFCIIAVILGAAIMALCSHKSNGKGYEAGRTAAIVSFLASFLIGGATVYVNFFFNTGQAVH